MKCLEKDRPRYQHASDVRTDMQLKRTRIVGAVLRKARARWRLTSSSTGRRDTRKIAISRYGLVLLVTGGLYLRSLEASH